MKCIIARLLTDGCWQVHVAVNYWKDLVPAEQQVKLDAEQLARYMASQGQPGTSAAAAAATASESDDEVHAVEALTLDQAIAVRKSDYSRRFVSTFYNSTVMI